MVMAEGKFEEGKGRAKEAVGRATGDERMEAEGAVDRASGATKSKLSEIVDKLKAPFRR
jgi:uncharacterized protein YjbJ (UPF0337 family)